MGKNNPMYGKTHSLETRKKMSKSGQGKHSGERNSKSKITYKIAEEIRTFYKKENLTHKDLGKIFNISSTTIWRVINNQSWTRKESPNE